MTDPLVAQIKALSPEQRAAFLADLSPDDLVALEHYWPLSARKEQLPPPGDWTTWMICAGRGWGKTRTGAETVRSWVFDHGYKRIALVGSTAADVRDVMIDGESGLLNIGPSHQRPKWEPSKRRLTWPNGAIATAFSAEEPDRLRGPQHDAGWADEIAAWAKPDSVWANMMMGLRLGEHPRVVVTTTPRPTAFIKRLLEGSSTAVTRGRTHDNIANLPDVFINEVIAPYQGTRLGRQELDAELLLDVQGALWTHGMIDDHRRVAPEQLRTIVIAIDPAVTSNKDSDETGIIVAGVDDAGHFYVLEDLSGKYPPDEWSRIAIEAYHKHGADRIVAEVNNGGDLVAHTLRVVDPYARVVSVHASRGKRTRAEPVAMMYERGLVHHVDHFLQLVEQLTSWSASTGEASPDRLDALVWALTSLQESAPPQDVSIISLGGRFTGSRFSRASYARS